MKETNPGVGAWIEAARGMGRGGHNGGVTLSLNQRSVRFVVVVR